MATSRFNVCERCGDRTWVPRLFHALRDHSHDTAASCTRCGGRTQLFLNFPFGLGAGEFAGKVLHAFLPEEIVAWKQSDESTVRFYPFMVIVESLVESHCSVWLPYWHVVDSANGSEKAKYGQWAPFIDAESYASIAAKARKAGYAI